MRRRSLLYLPPPPSIMRPIRPCADECCGDQWRVAHAMSADASLAAAVGALSVHCGGSLNKFDTPDVALGLGVPIFQGEEHIGLPDPDAVPVWAWPAAGATGIEVNQNWVLNNMSGTVFWPAAYAWSQGLPYRGKGFVVATSPWGTAPCYVPTALWVRALKRATWDERGESLRRTS